MYQIRLIYIKPDVSSPLPKETVIDGHSCRIWYKSLKNGHRTSDIGMCGSYDPDCGVVLPLGPTTTPYQTIICAPLPLVNGSSVVQNMPTNGKCEQNT